MPDEDQTAVPEAEKQGKAAVRADQKAAKKSAKAARKAARAARRAGRAARRAGRAAEKLAQLGPDSTFEDGKKHSPWSPQCVTRHISMNLVYIFVQPILLLYVCSKVWVSVVVWHGVCTD